MMHAAALTAFGDPDVLQWIDVPEPVPGPGQIRIRVVGAGVGPTDVHIRSGELKAFPITLPFVLGFEAAGVVESLGDGVTGVEVGDEVAVLLREQGGYAELAVSDMWEVKAANVSWDAAAALPASAEAAIGVLRQLGVKEGEHLVILGAGGSVGLIGIQLALSMGVAVIAVARSDDEELITSLGATFVAADAPLVAAVSKVADKVDAVFDAAGAGQIPDAIALTGDPSRVVTLSDPAVFALGARMSTPGPDRAPDALEVTMPMLANGSLVMKPRTTVPMTDAAAAHEAMQAKGRHQKIVLTIE